jgi:predicted dehydrogenase
MDNCLEFVFIFLTLENAFPRGEMRRKLQPGVARGPLRTGASDAFSQRIRSRGAPDVLRFLQTSMNTFSRRDFLSAASAGLAVGALSTWPGVHAQSSTKPRIRIGQIGVGHAHAAGKMGALRASQDFEVVGIAEPDPERRAAAEKSQTYQGLAWLTEEQLLNAESLQAVAVETEVKNLVPTAARCVAAGKHLHLDKPGGESFPAFRALLEDATRRKLTVQMGYMFRYNPAFQLCFQLVRDGSLGEVFSIDTTMSKAIGPGERRSLAPYQGGSMFELGGHIIDAVVSVLGRPSKVTAHIRSSSPLRDGFADNQLAVLDYPGAAVGARRQFVVCGTGGTFDIRPLEPPQARLALDQTRGVYRKGYQDLKFPNAAGRYDGDFADLARVIRGEKDFPFSPEHDLAVQETLLLASGLPLT